MKQPIVFGHDLKWSPEKEVRSAEGFETRKDLPPCAAMWVRWPDGKINSLRFTCPCGCGTVIQPLVGGSGWSWNGDELSPTLQPSIQVVSACRWHGYLTDGVFVPV